MLTVRILILILTVVSTFQVKAVRGRMHSNLTFYAGHNLRHNSNNFLYELGYEKFNTTCTYMKYMGVGLRFERPTKEKNDFISSVNFFRNIGGSQLRAITPCIFLSPVCYKISQNSGINFKPGIGFNYYITFLGNRDILNMNITVAYGYQIPILNGKNFNYSPHEFTAKLGFGLNLKSVKDILFHSKIASFQNSGSLKGKFASTFRHFQNPVILRFSNSRQISFTESRLNLKKLKKR